MQNPFETPLSDSAAPLKDKKNPSRTTVVIRAISWLAVINFVFIGMIGPFVEMFEEFGIELPAATVLVVSMANFQCKFWFVTVPVSVLVYLGAEAVIWNSTRSFRRWTVGLFWFWLLLVFTTIAVTIGLPLMKIIGS